MNLEPENIFYGVLAFSWIEFFWGSYLSHRQRKIYKKHVEVPDEVKGLLDEETFTKARLYALDKSNFGAFQGIFSQVLSTVFMVYFAFKFLWDVSGKLLVDFGYQPSDEIYRSIVFTFLSNVFSTIIGLPFSIYSTFVLEEKHGFNQQTAGFYIKDQVKKFLISQVITFPLLAAVIKIVYWGGDFFFVYLWAFVVGFTLFMMIIYPEFIAPLFDKYTPLPEGELRTEIEQLAASIDFPLYKLFVVEGSKRSSHSNAYFYGFFNFKRIVLFDTLLEQSEREKLKSKDDTKEEEEKEEEKEEKSEEEKKKDEEKKEKLAKQGCSNPEILAVLGHELGHWKLNHVLKNIIIAEFQIFAMFALFGYLYKSQMLYTAFGFEEGEMPVLIGLMIILQFITAPYNTVLDFLMTALSRRFEFQADDFAATVLGRSEKLQSALVKLNNDNLGFPVYDWLYSAWHHSHPPILERLAVLKTKTKQD